MKIDLLITQPEVAQSVIMIDGSKHFLCLSQHLQTFLANVADELDRTGFSEATALLEFDRTPQSRPLLWSQSLKDSACHSDIATFDFILCRSVTDNKWHSEVGSMMYTLQAFLALILWAELPISERFAPGHFGERSERICLVCGQKNKGSYHGRANMGGGDIYGFPDYCEWPDCFSHSLERDVNPGYKPDFTAHDRHMEYERSMDEAVTKAVRGSLQKRPPKTHAP